VNEPTRPCRHCGGDGRSDLYADGVCALCHGSGEVPAAWWWDDDGTLHREPRTNGEGISPAEAGAKGRS
jgi:hypothetical protein